MRVYVILINARTDNEGIHTVHANGRDVIYMFTDADDASRYAMMLEAQDFPNPTAEAMDSEEIEEFCSDSNYEWVLVEEGMLVVPPETNLANTDWQADGQHRGKAMDEPAQDDASGTDYDAIRRKLEGLI
jgi:RES domain-containing protein